MNRTQLKQYIPIFIFAVVSALLFVGSYIYINQIIRSHYEKNKRQQIRTQIEYLTESVSNIILIRSRQLQLVSRASTETTGIDRSLKINKQDSIQIKAVIKGSGNIEPMHAPEVTLGNTSLWGDKTLSKHVRKVTNGHFNIYVKTENGYIQVPDNERNTGEFIPEFIHISDPAVQSVEKGISYYERVVNNLDTRLYLYKPLYINGNLSGMTKCGIDEGISGYLSKTFRNKENNTEILFLIKPDGTPILNNEASDLMADHDLLQAMFNRRSNYSEIFYRFLSLNDSKGVYIHYSYLPEPDMYAGIILPADTYRLLGERFKWVIPLIVGLIFIILNLVFGYLAVQYIKAYSGMVEAADNLAAGEIADAKHKIPKNKGGNSLLKIADYLDNLTGFAKSIVNDKPYKHYKPSKFDIPGQALLELKEDKDKLKEKGLIKKFTTEIKKKTEKGKNDINELLQYASEIKPLAADVIKVIYRILDIDQIGFFLVEKEDDKNYLELQAAFAYNKERFFQTRISAKDSLTGRAVLEKESVFLKAIPDDYTKIAGGFGEAKPRTLAIIPLIFNNEVQAVIEIAAMKNIQSYQIKFLEEVGENIASTISNIRNSKQTRMLLKQTEEQSKQIEIQRVELQEKIETHRRQNRRIDKELNEKRELINSIQKAAFLIELNLRGEILSINKNMLELFDADLQEWRNKKHKDFIVTDNYIDDYGGFFRDLSKDRVKYKIETISLKKGKAISFSVIYSPLRNARGRIKTVLLMAHKTDFES